MKTSSPNIADFTMQLHRAALARNTRIAYAKGWRCFAAWCGRHHIRPLRATPRIVVDFFVDLATYTSPTSGKMLSLGTLTLYRSAINKRFQEANRTSPTAHPKVGMVLKGLARLRPNAPRQVRALRERHLKAMLRQCPESCIGWRDAAILAVGFAAALRRSELCHLQVSDIEWVNEARGMRIHIRRSKTDQTGIGQSVAVLNGSRIKPRDCLTRYLNATGHTDGPLFQTMRRGGALTGNPLHPDDIARLVKHYVAAIGLNPQEFSAHSLRAGFVTSAAAHYARLDKIMAVTRHKNPTTVLKYIRDADAFTDHAGKGFL